MSRAPVRKSNYGDVFMPNTICANSPWVWSSDGTVSKLPPSTILEDAAKWVDIIAPPAPPYVAGSFKRRQDDTVARLTAYLEG